MVVKPTHSLILNQRHCYMIIFRKKRKLKKKMILEQMRENKILSGSATF